MRQRELRRIERIFIYHRWLYVIAIGLMALVYPDLPLAVLIALAGALAAANLATWYLYRRLKSLNAQTALSLLVLVVDGLASWGLMLLFIAELSALVYAVFVLIVIEGAVRFSLPGSLLTGGFFIVGLSTAWLYRVRALDMSFDVAAYVFWVGLITLVSIMVGMAVREGRKQRAYAEELAIERTLLLERRRVSNELHDTVLKSLQGLALEAHALARTAADNLQVEERSRYIEGVCNEMSREIRGVALELREEGQNGHADFGGELRALAADWSRESGVKSEVEVRGNLPELPLKLAHDLRRITGEALVNIGKHAGASHADVRIEYIDGRLKLEVIDDGRGFDSSGDFNRFVRAGRLGLVSMKERVELAGGSFEIASRSGRTSISVSIPLIAKLS